MYRNVTPFFFGLRARSWKEIGRFSHLNSCFGIIWTHLCVSLTPDWLWCHSQDKVTTLFTRRLTIHHEDEPCMISCPSLQDTSPIPVYPSVCRAGLEFTHTPTVLSPCSERSEGGGQGALHLPGWEHIDLSPVSHMTSAFTCCFSHRWAHRCCWWASKQDNETLTWRKSAVCLVEVFNDAGF